MTGTLTWAAVLDDLAAALTDGMTDAAPEAVDAAVRTACRLEAKGVAPPDRVELLGRRVLFGWDDGRRVEVRPAGDE